MQERRSFSGPETTRNAPARLDHIDDENFDDEIRKAEEEEWDQDTTENESEGFEETEESDPILDPPPLLAPRPRKSVEELSIESILARADNAKEYDIFEDIGAPLVERGDRVTYSIKKNGAHVGSVPHPFSYDKIQEKWGGGTYQVTLRSFLFAKKPGGGYLKSQSKMVEEPLAPPAPALASAHAFSGEKGSTMELLATLQQMNEQNRAEQKAELERVREENRLREERLERESRIREERLEKEARERQEKAEKEGQSTMMLMMKMMENSQKQSEAAAERQTNMLLALLKKDEPKEDKRSEKIFDMLLETLLDKKSKGDSLDPIALQKLLAEAREEGYSRASELRELAKEEALRMAASMGVRGGSDDEDEDDEKDEPKSTTRMLLDTIAPVLAGLAQGGAQAPAPQAMPMQRRVLPPGAQRALPPGAPRSVNPNLPARPPVTAPARQATPQAGLTQPQAPQAPKAAPQQSSKPQSSMVAAPKPQAARTTMKPSKKEIVAEIAINLITADLSANFLTGSYDPLGTAKKLLVSAKDHGLDAEWLVANFTLAEMKEIAKSKGMPEAINKYLEAFFDGIAVEVAATKAAQAPSAEPIQAAAVNPS